MEELIKDIINHCKKLFKESKYERVIEVSLQNSDIKIGIVYSKEHDLILNSIKFYGEDAHITLFSTMCLYIPITANSNLIMAYRGWNDFLLQENIPDVEENRE